MNKKKLFMQIPIESWDVIYATLSMDLESNYIDNKIKKELRKSLKKVKIVAVNKV